MLFLHNSADERTVRDLEFRASHQPLGGRSGVAPAPSSPGGSRDSGPADHGGPRLAEPDWVVEGYGGERWPVTDEQFRRTYRAVNGYLAS